MDVVFLDVSPIASRVETGGSGTTPAIRLQRLFVILPDFPRKTEAQLQRCLIKISDTSMKIYDIIKPALATCLGSAAVRESRTLAEPPIIGFYGCRHIVYQKSKENTIFFFSPILILT